MVRKGKLPVFESSGISETVETTPTKIDLHAFYINPYLYNFFWADSNWFNFLTTMDYYSPWSKREIWQYLNRHKFLKLESMPTRTHANPELFWYFFPFLKQHAMGISLVIYISSNGVWSIIVTPVSFPAQCTCITAHIMTPLRLPA